MEARPQLIFGKIRSKYHIIDIFANAYFKTETTSMLHSLSNGSRLFLKKNSLIIKNVMSENR